MKKAGTVFRSKLGAGLAAFAVGAAAFSLVLSRFGVPPADTIKFVLGLALGVYCPGRALLALARRKEKSFLAPFLATALLTAPFLLAAHLLNRGGMSVQAKFHFTNWMIYSLLDAKIMPLVSAWGDFIRFLRPTLARLPLILAAPAVFLVGSMGVAFPALPSLFKQTWVVRRDGLMNVFLGFLFFACLGFFFFTTPCLGGHARNWLIVDAFKVGAFILLVYASRWLVHVLRNARPAVKAGAVAAVLLLSVLNTAHFIWLKRTVPETMIVEQPFLEACRFLNDHADPESVVLHSRHVRYVCYFADRRVVLDDSPHSYLDYHLEPARLQERRNDIEAFFADPAANGQVLDKYRVSHVWVKRMADTSLWGGALPERLECAVPSQTPGTARRLRLDLVFRNSRNALFEVRPASSLCTRSGRRPR